MEIERKYLINKLPDDLDKYNHSDITQAYLSTDPVLRIRSYGEKYFFTYKGEGLLARQEEEFEISASDYEKLLAKHIGKVISKTRYVIPYNIYNIELDVFYGEYDGLIIAEVEFDSIKASETFTPPDYFGEEVTYDGKYHNSNMAMN